MAITKGKEMSLHLKFLVFAAFVLVAVLNPIYLLTGILLSLVVFRTPGWLPTGLMLEALFWPLGLVLWIIWRIIR